MINRGLLLIYCQKEDHSNPYAANVLGMGSNMQVAVKILFAAFWVSYVTLAEEKGKVPIHSMMYIKFLLNIPKNKAKPKFRRPCYRF